jgi:kinetochore protein Spc24
MFDGSPEQIIQQSIDSIEIEPELITLEKIEEDIKAISALRSRKIESLSAENVKLSETITNLQKEIDVLTKISDENYEIISNLTDFEGVANDRSVDMKLQNIFKLFNQKFSQLDTLKLNIAKSLTDLESNINSLQLSKVKLSNDLSQVKTSLQNVLDSPDISNVSNDSNILKINLYRNLGIKIETVENTDTIIIYDKETNSSSILTAGEKLSDYFISNYIWERLEGMI